MTDFQEAIESDDLKKSLVAIRGMLAETMSDLRSSIKKNQGLCRKCGGSLSEAGLATLAKQLKEVIEDLDALQDPREETELDELAKRRDIRRSAVAPDIS